MHEKDDIDALTDDELAEILDALAEYQVPIDTDLDKLPYEERKKWCYCKSGQSHCGTCEICGQPGHIRSLMCVTLCWCDACYRKALAEEQ